jgi:hypothetical protein
MGAASRASSSRARWSRASSPACSTTSRCRSTATAAWKPQRNGSGGSAMTSWCDEGGKPGSRGQGRWLADAGLTVGADRALAAARALAPAGLPPAAGAGSRRDGAILLVLRTGIQWNTLNASGAGTARSRFCLAQTRVDASVLSEWTPSGGHKTDTSETTRASSRDASPLPATGGFAGKTASRMIARVRA